MSAEAKKKKEIEKDKNNPTIITVFPGQFLPAAVSHHFLWNFIQVTGLQIDRSLNREIDRWRAFMLLNIYIYLLASCLLVDRLIDRSIAFRLIYSILRI